MSSLEGVKVGDKLAIYSSMGSLNRIATVEKVTTKHAVTTEGKSLWRIDDGGLRGADTWSRSEARLATEKDFLILRIRQAEERIRRFQVTAANIEAVELLLAESRTKTPVATS